MELVPGLTRIQRGELTGLRIETPLCTGEIFDQGAHLTSFAPTGAGDLLFLSREAQFATGKAIRGGIPICAPWFGPGRSGDRVPAHGIARTSLWSLVGADRAADVVQVTYELESADDRAPAANYRLVADFGAALQVSLTVSAVDSLELEEALHAYFRISDAQQVAVRGLDGADYLDKVAGDRHRQDGDVRITGEVDRVYDAAGPIRIIDADRTVLVEPTGTHSTVVWNPWVEKSRSFTDFADDEWQQMVCVETGSIGDRAILLRPGESHTMTTRYCL